MRTGRISCENGIKSRAELPTHMADLLVDYPDMSSKRINASRAAWGPLYGAFEPSKTERSLNNERIRKAIIPSLVDHMAFGAKWSGGMNSEIERWFSWVGRATESVFRTECPPFSPL